MMTEGQDAAVVRELLKPFSAFLQDPSLYEVIVNRPESVDLGFYQINFLDGVFHRVPFAVT